MVREYASSPGYSADLYVRQNMQTLPLLHRRVRAAGWRPTISAPLAAASRLLIRVPVRDRALAAYAARGGRAASAGAFGASRH
jgi:hypothetical protein